MIEQFFWPTFGGVLIGLSATFLLLSLGKIAGIAGIVWGAIFSPALRNQKQDSQDQDTLWRWVFLVGMIIGAALLHLSTGKPYPAPPGNLSMAVIGGLFVGIGVRLGNGCTSGHGVCGIGRLSFRSLIATGTFMLVAIVTVALINLAGGQ